MKLSRPEIEKHNKAAKQRRVIGRNSMPLDTSLLVFVLFVVKIGSSRTIRRDCKSKELQAEN